MYYMDLKESNKIVFKITCKLNTGERVWFRRVLKVTDPLPEWFLGLTPEVTYFAL